MKQTKEIWIRFACAAAAAIGLSAAFHSTAGEAAASPGGATATPAEHPHTALAKQSQNPVASLISVPFQNNFNFETGLNDDVQYNTLIQPVIPVSLSEDWNLINRSILPVMYQPRMSATVGSAWGLGDFQYQGYLSPAKPGKLIWGAGPVLNFPTATDSALGSGKYGAGPGVVLLTMPGPWVIGTLVNNVWSYAGWGANDVNTMTWQYFVNYNIPGSKGWYLSSAPTMTVNWEAPGRDQWTVPVGGGVGKVFKIGKQPMNAKVQFFGYPAKPDLGPDWGMQFQLTFLFPHKK